MSQEKQRSRTLNDSAITRRLPARRLLYWSGTGTPADPYVYTPAAGHLRIWTKDGSAARNPNSVEAGTPGDFVPSDTYEDLTKLGFSAQTRVVTLYVEGIDVSAALADQRIKVEVDPDGEGPLGFIAVDAVRTTVMRVDLDAYTIYRNSPAGLLPDWYEESIGAWVPQNNDDDNYDASNTPDYQEIGAIAGENDLLPIVLHTVQPLGVGGTYQLVFDNQAVRVWRNADRTGEVISASTQNATSFDATMETTLYVEELAASGVSCIWVNWENATVSHVMMDLFYVNAFSWQGPLNVPGYSIYRYTATGGMPGAGNSMWIDPLDGTLNSSTQGDALDEANILWDSGPVVGKALYQAQTNYVWGLDVNVVQIELGNSNTDTYGSPIQDGGAGSAMIKASNATNAMTADITVHKVEGPTVNGVQRGKKFMEIGLSHQARFDAKHALYNDSTPPKRIRSSLEDGAIHWDVGVEGTIPWTFLDANHHLDITSDNTVISDYKFSTYDNPRILTTNQFILNGDQADVLAPVMHHWVPLIVRTKDTRVVDPIDVWTELAMLEWTFDGTGTVDAAGAWTLTGSGVTVPDHFTVITDGRRLPDAQGNFNELLAPGGGQTWITENQ